MGRVLNRLLRRARNDSGATAVEFAFIAPVFIVFVFAVIEIGRLMFMGASIQWAIDRAARTVVITEDATASDIQAEVDDYLEPAGSPSVTISTAEELFDGVTVMRVSAHYDHQVYGPF